MIASHNNPASASLTSYATTPEGETILGGLQFLTSEPTHMEVGVVPTEAVMSVLEAANKVASESHVDTSHTDYTGHRNGPTGCIYHGTVALRNRIDLSSEFVGYDALMKALGAVYDDDELLTGYINGHRITSSSVFSPLYWLLTAVSMYEDDAAGKIVNGCYTETHIPTVVISTVDSWTNEPGGRICNVSIETGESEWLSPHLTQDEIDENAERMYEESKWSCDDLSAGDCQEIAYQEAESTSDSNLSFDEQVEEIEKADKGFECDVCGETCYNTDRTVSVGETCGHADCIIKSVK